MFLLHSGTYTIQVNFSRLLNIQRVFIQKDLHVLLLFGVWDGSFLLIK